jgi:SAM-dependent methyltransferase
MRFDCGPETAFADAECGGYLARSAAGVAQGTPGRRVRAAYRSYVALVPSFAQLLAAGERADIHWDLARLFAWGGHGTTTGEFDEVLGDRLSRLDSALDLQTGDGSRLAQLEDLPDHMVVTEGDVEDLRSARSSLEPLGVWVVRHSEEEPLPFGDNTFELVSALHPRETLFQEIARVLTPGGAYLAQHLGPAGGFELVEHFLGAGITRSLGHLDHTIAAARDAGLDVVDVRHTRLRLEFRDVAAVVYTLRKLIWWVPDFSVERYAARLALLHEQIRSEGSLVTHATRYLVEAVKPVE